MGTDCGQRIKAVAMYKGEGKHFRSICFSHYQTSGNIIGHVPRRISATCNLFIQKGERGCYCMQSYWPMMLAIAEICLQWARGSLA